MKPSKSQLDDLLSYLPALETPGRMFGEAQGLEPETNQQAAKPRVNFAQDVELFLRCASQPWFTDFEYAQKKPQFWLEDPNFWLPHPSNKPSLRSPIVFGPNHSARVL